MRKKEEKKKLSVSSIICIALLILMLPILIINGVILVNSCIHPNEVPDFMGYKPFIVLSGSMEPTIMTGDLAISKEAQDNTKLNVGDIISFRISDSVIVTHRIVKITEIDGETAYITRGDNNYEDDANPVRASLVEGVFVKNIAKLGNVAIFIQKPIGFIVTAAVPVLIIIIAQFYSSRQYKKELEKLRKKSNEKKD